MQRQAKDVAAIAAELRAHTAGTDYTVVNVSWEDVERKVGPGGQLPVLGRNSTDVRIKSKDNTLLYTLRSNNWNEKLAKFGVDDIDIVVGNQIPGGAALKSIKLGDYLRSLPEYAKYAGVGRGVTGFDKFRHVLVRAQTVFVPVTQGGTFEFSTEIYSYNAGGKDEPRNLVLLCTPQGTSVQTDRTDATPSGRSQVLYHNVNASGDVCRYYLEAEATTMAVGQDQSAETEEEARQAAERGKAVAVRIGPACLGRTCNAQLVAFVPLTPPPQQQPGHFGFSFGGVGMGFSPAFSFGAAGPLHSYSAGPLEVAYEMPFFDDLDVTRSIPAAAAEVKVAGESFAARVSHGSQYDVYTKQLVPTDIKPDPDVDFLTLTITLYHALVLPLDLENVTMKPPSESESEVLIVPSGDDIKAAMAQLDAVLNAAPVSGTLSTIHGGAPVSKPPVFVYGNPA